MADLQSHPLVPAQSSETTRLDSAVEMEAKEPTMILWQRAGLYIDERANRRQIVKWMLAFCWGIKSLER